jgi:hypothetical protein
MTPLDRARLSLLRFAAKAYGEPLHENSVQWKHGCIWIDDDLPYAGDTLALFLLRELNDVTFGAVDETALHSTAIQGLNTAIRDLERVRDALMTRRIETDQTEIKEEAMMDQTFFRTLVTIEILSDEPIPNNPDVEILGALIRDGDYAGVTHVSESQEISARAIPGLLTAMNYAEDFFKTESDREKPV